jgi:hypothetical protein
MESVLMGWNSREVISMVVGDKDLSDIRKLKVKLCQRSFSIAESPGCKTGIGEKRILRRRGFACRPDEYRTTAMFLGIINAPIRRQWERSLLQEKILVPLATGCM